ncbi:Pre-mRNA-processing ATP-dependent RNA helicase PRP5 [Nakaseomyces bracarensis]|uniref:RNA helicase n=1 Tax=Nakaseomyces bracarensis TaxID=273131 RepID=A0ABR4NMR6_9SACH
MVDNEEQKRQARLAKLARWKQKKQQEAVPTQHEPDTNKTTRTNDYKAAVRLAKLEKWKKRKLEVGGNDNVEKVVAIPPISDKKPLVKLKTSKKKAKTGNIFVVASKKENLPNENEKYIEDPINVDGDQGDSDGNGDALDDFMNVIEKEDYGAMGDQEILDTANGIDEDTYGEDTVAKVNSGINEEKEKLAKIKRLKSKKNLVPIKYDLNKMESIKKMLYIEPEEIKKYSEEEIADLRLNLDNIKIEGNHCPRPVTKWSQLGLPESIINIIRNDLNYDSLTPIQCQTIPAIMMGSDVIGISKTGSGKTISYLLPLIRHVKAQRRLNKDESGPIALVFAPTRELALQINDVLETLLKNDTSIKTLCCTGGSEMRSQINTLKRGTEIIVATPGRFIDLLTLNGGNLVSSQRISFVVMDEADRLFDFGFEPQISSVLRTVRPDKQCVLFSATFPSKLSMFAMRFLKHALKITINSEGLVNDRITQAFKVCSDEASKFQDLINILSEHKQNSSDDQDEKVIVFVSSQQICDVLEKRLNSYNIHVYSIHAGKPYHERMQNLTQFKIVPNSVLLCTEVLSRGLNVPEVSKVILYNAAKTFAQYVHSTGRTARGTKSGNAITLILPNELSSAYILSKAISADNLKAMKKDDIGKLQNMASKFNDGLKSGKYKLSTGLGGKGLDHLDKQRMDAFTPGEVQDETSHGESNPHYGSDLDINLPNLKDISIERIEGDNLSTMAFRAIIIINDLPQIIRWEMTKNTTLASIIGETGCSITLRGKFYAEGTSPDKESDEPKLYLLIEASNEKDVRQCIQLLEENIKIGLKKATLNTLKSTKY